MNFETFFPFLLFSFLNVDLMVRSIGVKVHLTFRWYIPIDLVLITFVLLKMIHPLDLKSNIQVILVTKSLSGHSS